MSKYGSWDGWVGTRYSTLPAHPHPTLPRVHPSPYPYRCTDVGVRTEQPEVVVGLKSVAQLTLDSQISGFQGITEVYNLRIADNPNDHFFIPGNK